MSFRQKYRQKKRMVGKDGQIQLRIEGDQE